MLSLAPNAIILPLWFIAMALPNLVFSGIGFADPIHTMKWVVSGAPIAIAALAAGLRLLWYGGDRLRVRLDAFALLWGLMILYCAAQPLWVEISSIRGMIHEMICLVGVWAFYVLSVNAFPSWGLSPLLWLAGVNGAINVLFAELQIRGMRDLAFLRGTFLEFLQPLSALISPEGQYFGNTFQKNMMGLWMAVCTLSMVFLFVAHTMGGKKRPLWVTLLNLGLMAVNVWGLWNSFSIGGVLALLTGLLVMGMTLWSRFRLASLKRLGLFLLLLVALFGGLMVINPERGEWMADHIVSHLFKTTWTFGGRAGIWATSATMFKEHPAGVGLGQFKWHYLEAQREGFKTIHEPWYFWRNTAWAHNEFLQWFCEAGVIGGVMLLLMLGLWAVEAVRGVRRVRREGSTISPEALWGCAMVALFVCDALWTRPFHRIENFLWMVLALAVTNREFWKAGWDLKGPALRLVGLVCACASVAGLVYLGSVVQGDRLLRQARNSTDGKLVLTLLREAEKHPAAWEEAQRNLGQYDIQLGENLKDTKIIGRGYQRLLESFRREPRMNDVGMLLDYAQGFQFEDDIRELFSYLQPGAFHLERRMTMNNKGEQVNALFVVQGPAPEQ